MRLLACGLAGVLLLSAPAAVWPQDDSGSDAAPPAESAQPAETPQPAESEPPAEAAQPAEEPAPADAPPPDESAQPAEPSAGGQDSADMQAPPQGGQYSGDAGGGGTGGGDQGGSEAGGDAQAGPVSLGDAKANIGTLVQSFIAQRSAGGVWPLRDKRTKQLRQLKLVSVDEKHVAPAGKSRFSAPALLKDQATGQTLAASFIADFSGPDWRIVGMRLKGPVAPPPASKKKRT